MHKRSPETVKRLFGRVGISGGSDSNYDDWGKKEPIAEMA